MATSQAVPVPPPAPASSPYPHPATVLDYHIIKVPCEGLSAHFQRVRKKVTKEIGQVVGELTAADNVVDEAKQANLLARLRALREVILQTDAEEKELINRCQQRLEAVLEMSRRKDVDVPQMMVVDGEGDRVDKRKKVGDRCCHGRQGPMGSPQERRQLERLVGEYMIRMGYFEGAALLETEANLKGMLDIDLFRQAAEVEVSISKGHACGPALQWCSDHASRLRRINSKLEFELHKRYFLELVRAGSRMEALSYASEHLSLSCAPPSDCLAAVQQAMATLVFPDPVACPVQEYAQLFHEERWQELAHLFRHEVGRVYGVGPRPALEVCLQAGISALKTPLCYNDEQRNLDCPICSEAGRMVADPLPFAHFGNSHLICRLTGDLMDEHNPPVALPNGQVYSSRAVKELLSQGGEVICPRTKEGFPVANIKTVYII